MKNDILKDFGMTVRFHRNQMGISQEKLADVCGFHRTYVGQIERGERNPALKNIEIFAKAFGINLSELFQTLEHLKNNK